MASSSASFGVTVSAVLGSGRVVGEIVHPLGAGGKMRDVAAIGLAASLFDAYCLEV